MAIVGTPASASILVYNVWKNAHFVNCAVALPAFVHVCRRNVLGNVRFENFNVGCMFLLSDKRCCCISNMIVLCVILVCL